MASKIYQYSKSMSSATAMDNKETWKTMMKPMSEGYDACPIIAKGNIYEGITAQW